MTNKVKIIVEFKENDEKKRKEGYINKVARAIAGSEKNVKLISKA